MNPQKLLGVAFAPLGRRFLASRGMPAIAQFKEDRLRLTAFIPTLVSEAGKMSEALGWPAETTWLTKMLEYTMSGGKMIRAGMAVNAFRELLPQCEERQAMTTAWAFEVLHASYLISDDLCDGADLRRGRAAWHRVANAFAGNDSLILSSLARLLIKESLKGNPGYSRVLELFNTCIFRTMVGQNCDMHLAAAGSRAIDMFSAARFRAQGENKTSFYSVYAPVAAAMHLAGMHGRQHETVWSITADIGIFYQVMDDLLDCYERTEKMGKRSTDIQNGKCTWLIVEALARATDQQRALLRGNYGREDGVDVVKSVYDELGLRAEGAAVVGAMRRDIVRRIHEQTAVPPAVLLYGLAAEPETKLA